MHDATHNTRAILVGGGHLTEKLKQSSSVLLISVGQPYHEGKKLELTLDLINKKFKRCTIAVNDTLQRHTMGISSADSREQLYQDSLIAGDEWLRRNQHHIEKMTIPCEITRWDMWLKDSEYTKHREIIDALYEKDEEFNEAMHSTIVAFIERREAGVTDDALDRVSAYAKCLEYLKEECAIIMPMWLKFGYDYILYPGKIIDVLAVARERLVVPCCDIQKWIRIRFIRKNRKIFKSCDNDN